MTIHPIFSNKYTIWWFSMAVVTSLKIILFGYKQNGLAAMAGYETKGLLFWVIGVIFCAIVFSTPIYLIYRLINKKWNDKVFMILISVFVGLLLIFII